MEAVAAAGDMLAVAFAAAWPAFAVVASADVASAAFLEAAFVAAGAQHSYCSAEAASKAGEIKVSPHLAGWHSRDLVEKAGVRAAEELEVVAATVVFQAELVRAQT